MAKSTKETKARMTWPAKCAMTELRRTTGQSEQDIIESALRRYRISVRLEGGARMSLTQMVASLNEADRKRIEGMAHLEQSQRDLARAYEAWSFKQMAGGNMQ